MRRKLILIGGGGHAKACIDVIESCKDYKINGIIDLADKIGTNTLGYPIIGNDKDIEKYIRQDYWFLVTIGHIKNAIPRENAYKNVITSGGKLATIISPLAYVSKHATVKEGSIIMHGAKVNAASHVGANCIVNTNADIEHDTFIDNNTHISTHSVINGGCRIGNRVFIGSCSVVTQNVHICDDVIIGAGTNIHKSITEKGTYVGASFTRIS